MCLCQRLDRFHRVVRTHTLLLCMRCNKTPDVYHFLVEKIKAYLRIQSFFGYVRNVVATVFISDVQDWEKQKLIKTLGVGIKAKEGGRGKGEKKTILFSLPALIYDEAFFFRGNSANVGGPGKGEKGNKQGKLPPDYSVKFRK